MRQVDQKESFAPLGAPIRPEPTKPAAPRPEGPSGVVTINGKAQTTSHPKPPMRNYSDILDTQGMVHRDSFPPNSLKWVGEAADAWRGIHAQQAADMEVIRDLCRKADRD